MAFARFRLPLYGFLAGVLLSAMRAPLGLDWTQLAVVDATTAALFRALALVTIALFLDGRRPAFQNGMRPMLLLPALSAGFLLHGLLLSLPLQPGCRLGIAIAFVSATLALWLVAGRSAKPGAEAPPSEWTKPLGNGERTGLLMAGLGASLAIETVAQHVRLLGQGLPGDDTIIGGFLLLWTTAMVVCFGFNVGKSAGKNGSLAACSLAFGAAVSVYGLKFLAGLGREGLWAFLRGVPLFTLESGLAGTWPADLWISATSMVPIGLALGITLLAARHPARLATLLIGAAMGLLLRPYVVNAIAHPLAFPAEIDNTWAWQLVVLGSALAGVGAMLCARADSNPKRLFVSLFALACATAPLLIGQLKPVVIWSFSPWLKYDVFPELVIPSAAGVISVEPRPNNEIQVNVDRRRVTPSAFEQEVDVLRLTYSLALADPELRHNGQLRVLLLGQLTPERDGILRLSGIRRLDRTASWYSSIPSIERHLFREGSEPLGQLISPAQARARLRSGEYDLVISLPASSPDFSPRGAGSVPYSSAQAPTFGSLEVPEGTLGVVWVNGSAPLHTRAMGNHVLLAMDHMEQLSVGVIFGELAEKGHVGRPLLFDSGDPLWPASIWTETTSQLSKQVSERIFDTRTRLLRRLGQAPSQSVGRRIARALEQHFALQVRSSPFENPAYAIEWDEKIFAELFAALGSLERLDPFTRSLGEDLYWVLTEKRLSDLVIVYGEALADRFTPWPAADRALARAYKELLEPERSLEFWLRVVEANPFSIEDYMRCADAAVEAENPTQAVQTLQQALKVQPGRFDLRRALGISLQKAGDSAGDALLRDLLATSPEDNLIRAALGLELIPELDDPDHDH